MEQKYEILKALILKSARGEATEQENAELKEWLNADPQNRSLVENFNNQDWLISELKERETINDERAKQKLWALLGNRQ